MLKSTAVLARLHLGWHVEATAITGVLASCGAREGYAGCWHAGVLVQMDQLPLNARAFVPPPFGHETASSEQLRHDNDSVVEHHGTDIFSPLRTDMKVLCVLATPRSRVWGARIMAALQPHVSGSRSPWLPCRPSAPPGTRPCSPLY